jgi:hypothetical protein
MIWFVSVLDTLGDRVLSETSSSRKKNRAAPHNFVFISAWILTDRLLSERVKGSVGEGEAGKKTKA